MKIIEFAIDKVPVNDKEFVLCLGFYDGLHLGHQKLIKTALKEGVPVGIMTFDVAPAVLLGKKENFSLTSTFDKVALLEKLCVKYFFLMQFDQSTLKVTKDEFINRVLKPLNPQKIYVGEDYKFGAYAEGDVADLKRFFDVQVVPIEKSDGLKIASNKIREFVEAGEMEKAASFLGRSYRICGLVVEGAGNGKKIGFPTANLALDYPYVFPGNGVYIGYAHFLNRKRKAIISVGTHPTINQLLKPIIEVYVINFEGSLYGKEICVDFVSKIREMIRFDSPEELTAQIIKDEQTAKNTLK
ncbi:MAG: riboflavin biosynthesis protein RibF [Erysipelotrichia bacterium]|nr:riboflavin biosynthesis protein RibF [Erysipelotrichia bacterium]